jgi:hypothetical protein
MFESGQIKREEDDGKLLIDTHTRNTLYDPEFSIY